MSYIIVGIVTICFVIYMNKKENLKYNSLFYGICASLFGLLFSMFMYFGKYYKDREDGNTASTVFYVLAGFMALLNIFIVLLEII